MVDFNKMAALTTLSEALWHKPMVGFSQKTKAPRIPSNGRCISPKLSILCLPCKKQTRARIICAAASPALATPILSNTEMVMKQARKMFSEEISAKRYDHEISLVKAMLLISAEDEAFMASNREKDRLAACQEGGGRMYPGEVAEEAEVLKFLLAGKTIPEWLSSFEALTREVLEKMDPMKVWSTNPLPALKVVNDVLFSAQGFSRSPSTIDVKKAYLHHAMALRRGNGVMLNIIYMEICKHLGIDIGGILCGQTFFIWPVLENQEDNAYILREEIGSWFYEVNGASLRSKLLTFNTGLENASIDTFVSDCMENMKPATTRDIITIALRNLKKLHWKQACRSCPAGYNITNPLEPVSLGSGDDPLKSSQTKPLLLRPHDLRLAIMASEKLLKLQPRDWALRRDHGLLLYHSRRYGEAVQELSICMAFAPTEEAQLVERFVEKLHLLRLESSWNVKPPNAPSALA